MKLEIRNIKWGLPRDSGNSFRFPDGFRYRSKYQ